MERQDGEDQTLNVDVLSLSYPERRLVVVQRDDLVLAHRQSRASGQPDESQDSWAGTRKWLQAQHPAVAAGATAAAVSFMMINPVARSIAAGIIAKNAVTRRRYDSMVLPRVLPITYDEARTLTVPLGHPVFDTVYAAHPAQHEVYYPLAQFHRLAFEHKFAEALRLVTSLGASLVRVVAVQGWTREFLSGLDVGDALGAARAGVHVEMESGRRRKLEYSATLAGHTDPRLPSGMVWYPHEEAWREMARQRLEHGLRSFELTVAYHDDYAVTAELATSLKGVGLQIGGEFKQHESTVWVIIGEFAS